MSNPFIYLWRHPRRTGFIALNIVVVIAFLAWGAFTEEMSGEGLAGVPNMMLGYTGMALLVVLWIVAWIAWAWFLGSRQFKRRP